MTGSTIVEPPGSGGRRPGRGSAEGRPGPRVRPRRSPEDRGALLAGPSEVVHPPDADAVPVLAVLVAHDGARWLPRTLAALVGATRRPDVLVAVDTGSVDGSRDLLAAAPQVSAVVTLPRTASPGQAVAVGVARAREVLAASWVPSTGRRARGVELLVWIVHDDSAPAADALEMLLGSMIAAPTVAVAGCKLVAWDDPAALVEVGVTVSPTGRRVTGLAPGERDQGQHDSRSDVLAVSTAGALLRWDVVESVGAFDPAVPLVGDDIDLCRRVRAAGHRVVVVPAARCEHVAALETGVRSGDALLRRGAARRRRGPSGDRLRGHRRRHAIHSRVVAAGPWRALPTLAWLFLEVVGQAGFLLGSRRPGAAAGELVAWWSVASTPWRIAAGLRRAGPTRPSGRAAVRRLQPSGLRLAADRLEQELAEAARRVAGFRPHPVLLVAAAAAAVAGVLARVQAPGPGMADDAGLGIRTVAATGLTASELWQRTVVGAAPADPATTVWAVLSGVAGVATGRSPAGGTLAEASVWAGWAVVPVAVVAAWALVREVAPGRRVPLTVGVAWALLPGLAAAAATGYAATTDERLVHALAPVPLWALLVAARRRPVPWLGTAVAAGALAAVVTVALQPATWPVLVGLGTATGLAVVARRGPARRWRLLAVLAVTAAPGVAFPAWSATAWTSFAVLLLPPAHRTGAPVADAVGEGAWIPVDPVAGVALLALGALLAGGLAAAGLGVLRSPAARVASVAAVVLAASAVVASGTTAALPDGRVRGFDPVWTAPLLGLVVAAAAGVAGRRPRALVRRGALAAAVALVVAWVGAGVVVTVPSEPGLPVPATVDAASPSRLGTLTLTVRGGDGDGVATVTWALDRGQPGPGSASAAEQARGAVSPEIEDLATDLLGRSPDATAPDRLAAALAAQAVGWIVVDGPEGTAAPVIAAVGTRSGLGEVARVPGRVVWRVDREGPPPVAAGAPVTVAPLGKAALPWAGAAVLVVLLVVGAGRRAGSAPALVGEPGSADPPAPPLTMMAATAATAAGVLVVGLVVGAVVGGATGSRGAGAAVPELVRAVTLAAPGERAVCPGDTAAVVPVGAGGEAADATTSEVTSVSEAITGDGDRSGLQAGAMTSGTGAGALVLAACPAAAEVGYAFTGGTAPGRRPRLVLANPGDVPAGVAVALLTSSGRVPGGSVGALSVEAGGLAAVAVDALAVVEGVAAVEVRAETGAVAGTLRDTAVAGLRAAGTDDEALVPPGTRLVIPVVTVPDPGPDPAGGAAGAGSSLVAVGVPGEAAGVARVTVVPTADAGSGAGSGDAGRGSATTEVVALVPGGTALVALPAPGTYAVWIESDVPVAAAARSVRTRADGALDVGWASAVAATDVSAAVVPVPALPEGSVARLHLTAEADATVDVDLLDGTGAVVDTRRLTVAAGTATSAPLDAVPGGGTLAGVRLRSAPGEGPDAPPGGAVRGALGLSLSSADGLATTSVRPRGSQGAVVSLVPR